MTKENTTHNTPLNTERHQNSEWKRILRPYYCSAVRESMMMYVGYCSAESSVPVRVGNSTYRTYVEYHHLLAFILVAAQPPPVAGDV